MDTRPTLERGQPFLNGHQVDNYTPHSDPDPLSEVDNNMQD